MLLISIFVFIFIFTLIVLIHEMGHFFSARRHQVHVEEFGLGIPPRAKTLWKDKKKCIYSLNWIPFGGFVKMEGEDLASEKAKKTKGSFAAKSLFARMEIVLAGPFMNFILAIFILTVLFTIGSKPILLNYDSIIEYVDKGVIITESGIEVVDVSPGGAASKAGILKGDIIKKVDDIVIDNAKQFKEFQKADFIREYTILRKKITNTESQKKEEILKIPVKSNSDGKIQITLASIPPIKEIKDISFPWYKSLVYSFYVSGKIAHTTIEAFKNLIIKLVLQAEIPENVSGPVGIASMTHDLVVAGDIENLFKFIALLSLSLSIMNALPIPALDGGRFLFLLVEGVLQKPIKPQWEARINSIAFISLMILIFIVTGHDIYKIIMQ